jgi:acyl-CoA synthetase (NDP forming)
VIGATRNPIKLGHKILKAVIGSKFCGQVYPVGIQTGPICCLKSYRSVLEISDKVDLALVAVPSSCVLKVIEECGLKGVSHAIVFSAGFSETKNGMKLEQELIDTADRSGTRIIGPNTNGIRNFMGLNATFTPKEKFRIGNVGIICQSGGYGRFLLEYGEAEALGFSKFINLGNSCDVGFAEVLDFLACDPFTKVILLHIEGFKKEGEGRKFMIAAKRAVKSKPIIVLKTGRMSSARRAIQSHTGSLAGSDLMYDGLFRQTRILRVCDGVEMIDIAKALSILRVRASGNSVAILTNLGGPAIVASDICESNGLAVNELREETKSKLGAILPSTASYGNPVDLASAWPNLKLYYNTLSILVDDAGVDAVILIVFIETRTSNIPAHDIAALSDQYSKPIVACILSPYRRIMSQYIMAFEREGIPCYRSLERAAKAMVGVIKCSRESARDNS